MANRTVKLVLDAKVDGLVNNLKTGKKAVSDFSRDLESWRKKNEQSLDTLGDSATKAGIGVSAAVALVSKAAIDWESAWAGVTKTVDGTPEQMGALEDSLRGLAKTLPATHAEIAGVAEAAGQLGVAREDISAFTRTMIDLSETTNLTADDAATSIAQFMNVMGTSGDKVDELGSALVALGNDGASTEKDIMSMATRLSGAGKLVGASEADVLALANAMSSVGIEAELGGGVMTRVMTRMYSDVQSGGEGLEDLAKVAGVSAEEFATAFENDPVRAVDMMVKGLEGVKLSGGNVVETMKDLGIKGTEEVGTLLRLAGAGDLLSESLDLGASSWEENSALAEEARKRYETTEAKITIAWNNIKDAAITAGGVMLPILANLAEGAAGLADWFGKIPGPIQGFLTILGGISGAGLLAVGGMIGIAKKAAELNEAFGAIHGTGGRAQRAISNVSKAISGAVVVGAALVAGKMLIEGINEAARSGQTDLEEYFNLLSTGGGAGIIEGLDFDGGNALSAGMLKDYASTLGDVTTEAAAAKRAVEYIGMAKLPGAAWVAENLGMFSVRDMTNDAGKLELAMGSLGRAFEMGEIDMAQQGFAEMATQLQLTDEEVGVLINKVPELKSALTGVATEGGIKIDPNDELGLVDLALGRIKVSAPDAAGALEGVGAAGSVAGAGGDVAAAGLEEAAKAAEDAQKEVDEFYDALVAIGAIAISEREALRGLEESFDAAAEAAKKNGKTLDDSTEKGRANGRALDGIASSTTAAMEAQRQAGGTMGDLAATMSAGREEFIKTAISMGMGKKEAGALADSLNLIPGAVFTEFDSNADDLGARIHDLADAIKATPNKSITIDDNSPEVKKAMEDLGYKVETLPNGKIKVTDNGTASATGKEIDAIAAKHRSAQILADAVTYGAESALGYLARNRTAVISTRVVNGGGQMSTGVGGRGGQTEYHTGGYTGPGGKYEPAGLVHKDEFVVKKESRGEFEKAYPGLLGHINRTGSLEGYATGGRVGAAESKVKSTKRAYDLIDGKATNRLRKLAAKDQWEAAKAELAAAKKSSKASADAAKKDAEARQRLSESRRDLRVDLRRGEITDAFTSGSGLGQVDKLREASRSTDYSMSKRKGLSKDAAALEKSLTILTKKSEGLKTALESATKQADELRSVRDSVAGDLRGEFSLSGMLSTTRQDLGATPFTARGISGRANAMAKRIEVFAGRLNRLRKMGYGETIIQEVAGLGTEDGITVAGVLMNATKGERNSIVGAYKRLDTASNKAGQYVTESMYRGGLDAADGLVAGLESKTKNVESAFYKLGKAGEKAFRRSLDMHSPSRTMFKAATDAGDGVVGGGLASIPKVSDVFAQMGHAAEGAFSPALSVPPSAEVARYAAQPAGGGQVNAQVIADAVAGAIANYQPVVNIDGRKFYGVMQDANRLARKR